MFKPELKSLQTSLCAVLSVLIIVLTAIVNVIDANPATVGDWNKVAAALFGLITAYSQFRSRDANKSSEDSGIKRVK